MGSWAGTNNEGRGEGPGVAGRGVKGRGTSQVHVFRPPIGSGEGFASTYSYFKQGQREENSSASSPALDATMVWLSTVASLTGKPRTAWRHIHDQGPHMCMFIIPQLEVQQQHSPFTKTGRKSGPPPIPAKHPHAEGLLKIFND
jgi:hypothetical protein